MIDFEHIVLARNIKDPTIWMVGIVTAPSVIYAHAALNKLVRTFEGILPDLVLIGMARPAAVAICMSGSEVYKKAMERLGSLPKWMYQWGLIPGMAHRPDHPEDDFVERWLNAARDA